MLIHLPANQLAFNLSNYTASKPVSYGTVHRLHKRLYLSEQYPTLHNSTVQYSRVQYSISAVQFMKLILLFEQIIFK